MMIPSHFSSAELSLCVHHQKPSKLPFWMELCSVKVGKKSVWVVWRSTQKNTETKPFSRDLTRSLRQIPIVCQKHGTFFLFNFSSLSARELVLS